MALEAIPENTTDYKQVKPRNYIKTGPQILFVDNTHSHYSYSKRPTLAAGFKPRRIPTNETIEYEPQ